MRIVKNERSWAIDLIGIVNKFLNNKTLVIKQAGGEVTINNGNSEIAKRKIMFPDLLLYGDENKLNIIQGWEIKLPDVPITDSNFIRDAQEKADVLNLNSTLLWNFNSAVLYIKNKSDKWEIYRTWNEVNHIRTRNDVETYKTDWINLMNKILVDINQFLVKGEIQSSRVDLIISKSILSSMIERNKKLVSNNIKNCSINNRTISIFFKEWWKEAALEYKKDETSEYDAYSKLIISNWILKITFSHLIKQIHNPAMIVESITDTVPIETADEIFLNLVDEIGFHSIFSPFKFGQLLPDSTWQDLKEYNTFLTNQSIDLFDHEILQRLLEESVNISRKEIIGQFTTPMPLANLLVKSTLLNAASNVIDPCCGSGTISKAVLELKKEILGDELAHETTWASDKFEYPLQIANLAMTDFSSINIPNKIFAKNVFNLNFENVVKIVSPETGELMDYKIPYFTSIVSNLPFVSFENITEDDKIIVGNLRKKISEDYGINLSKRSDLYTYIAIKLFENLDQGGRLGLILSNSWLGTNNGKEFFGVLQRLYHIEYILISGNKRWFKNAEVVTTLVILTKKDNLVESTISSIRFGVLNKSIEELDELELIDTVSNHILANINISDEILRTSCYSSEDIKEIQKLGVSLNTFFHNINWLLEIKDKLIPLTDKFNIIRGMRRGWDPMFYPNQVHEIEREYIQPVLKNSRNIKRLNTKAENEAFCCSDSLDTMLEKNNNGAISWINKFKDQTNNVGKPLVSVLQKSASPGAFWYEMNTNAQAELVTTLNPDKKLFWAMLNESSFINQRLIGLSSINQSVDLEINHALLNSIIGAFFIEGVGFGRGLGVLDLSSTNVSDAYMLNSDLLTQSDKSNIINKFRKLSLRDIKPFLEELEELDRKEFDLAVLRAYDLQDYYELIKQTVTSLQITRLTAKEI